MIQIAVPEPKFFPFDILPATNLIGMANDVTCLRNIYTLFKTDTV